MAADYLKAIKARRPHGPYNLCRYSFGGLVAFENARRPGFQSSLPASVVRVAANALIASARSHRGFYCGQLTLFTPMQRAPGLPSAEAIWRKHARTLSIIETRGDHSSMLSAPNADSTAASLTRRLCALFVRD